MSYFMRFFVEGEPVPTDADLASAFSESRLPHRLSGDVLSKDGEDFAVVEVNLPGSNLFGEELEEFRKRLEDVPSGTGKERVIGCLARTTAIIAVQVLFGTRSSEETLSALDPLWDHLITKYKGLIQADGEGFYEGQDLLLELD